MDRILGGLRPIASSQRTGSFQPSEDGSSLVRRGNQEVMLFMPLFLYNMISHISSHQHHSPVANSAMRSSLRMSLEEESLKHILAARSPLLPQTEMRPIMAGSRGDLGAKHSTLIGAFGRKWLAKIEMIQGKSTLQGSLVQNGHGPL